MAPLLQPMLKDLPTIHPKWIIILSIEQSAFADFRGRGAATGLTPMPGRHSQTGPASAKMPAALASCPYRYF
jgi:hypothetical protein